jgi:hypothetical protein
MELVLDADVQMVLETMQAKIPAHKLVSVAELAPRVAKLLWGDSPQEPVTAIILRLPKPLWSPSRSVSNESFLEPVNVGDDSAEVADGCK